MSVFYRRLLRWLGLVSKPKEPTSPDQPTASPESSPSEAPRAQPPTLPVDPNAWWYDPEVISRLIERIREL